MENPADQTISNQLEQTYYSMHNETPQQTIQNNAQAQADRTPTLTLTLRERLARSVQLRNQQREADIQTQQARAALINSQRQCLDIQRQYYEAATQSHRLYNEHVQLRNEYLTNNFNNFLAFERRHPPAQLPPRHELPQNRVNPHDPNFDPIQHIDYLLETHETQQNPNQNRNQNPNQTR